MKKDKQGLREKYLTKGQQKKMEEQSKKRESCNGRKMSLSKTLLIDFKMHFISAFN